MTAPDDINSWWERDVADRHHDKIGTVQEVYLDPTSGEPKWVAVKTSRLSSHASLAPLAGATIAASHITLGFDKDAVKNAPHIATDDELTPDNEDTLYHYYRLDPPVSATPGTAAEASATGGDAGYRDGQGDRGVDGAGRNGHNGDPSAGRSRRTRAGSLGAAFGDAARTIGQAASREVREARETAAQRRGSQRSGGKPNPPREGGADPSAHTGGATGPDIRRADQHETGGDAPEVTRIRRHVITEHLSATGEVLTRETHTEEERPDTR